MFASVKSRPSVDYVLRTLQQNNVELIKIDDQKANILIGLKHRTKQNASRRGGVFNSGYWRFRPEPAVSRKP